ncbi:MAG: superoxide dismutase [Micropepsaceae bacterium]
MPFDLMPLPYEQTALQPTISPSTVSIHYGKHHRGYVQKLNELVMDTPLANLSLDDIISKTWANPAKRNIFNAAAQIWNHDFYWKSLTPNGGRRPLKDLERRIQRDFGSFENFEKQFVEVAGTQFGSGWVWLVTDGRVLTVMSTDGAVTPSVLGLHPLLCCDVWEHAYYLDYQSDRPAYVRSVLSRLANWEFASERMEAFVAKQALTGRQAGGVSTSQPGNASLSI